MDADTVNALVESYINIQPDEPLYVQYIDYMSSILVGDFGQSYIISDQAVSTILAQALPWTLFLMSIALFLRWTMGIMLGAVMAYMEGSRFDVSMTTTVITLHAVPYYVVAIILLWILAFNYPIFPSSGRMDMSTTPGFNIPFMVGVLKHSILPILSMLIAGFGGPAVGMRGNSIRVLGEDYLRVARLRGLSTRRIALRYVARNAILPMYTGLLISIGGLFGGSVILERIFGYPGIGYYLFQGTVSRDYPVMMGGFLLITFAVIVGILVADLTYGKLDPRAGDPATRETY
ncbi:ABC transporter permease [Halomontanus rarus]|uniref:ABC transporter permease n=1 Tax=Halomontanus rarus TaxID=3034020 RepID=UPI002FF8488A